MVDVFDKAGALERVGEDVVLLKDLIKLCHEQCDSRMMVLMHDVRHKDLVAVKRHAHLLKGSLGNVGAAQAYEAALALEEAAVAGDVEHVEPLAEALIDAINRYFEVVATSLGSE
jgi:HPt (histidine-containing phosphotransfer) domain-containing protein